MPSNVYSCSIPNQGWLSLTKSMTFLHMCLRLVSGSREVWVRPVLWAGARHVPLHPTQRSRLHHCQALPTEALRKLVSRSPPSCDALCSPISSLWSYSITTASGHSPRSLPPKPPLVVQEQTALTHRETRSCTPAPSYRGPAGLGTGTIHLPSLLHPHLLSTSLSLIILIFLLPRVFG